MPTITKEEVDALLQSLWYGGPAIAMFVVGWICFFSETMEKRFGRRESRLKSISFYGAVICTAFGAGITAVFGEESTLAVIIVGTIVVGIAGGWANGLTGLFSDITPTGYIGLSFGIFAGVVVGFGGNSIALTMPEGIMVGAIMYAEKLTLLALFMHAILSTIVCVNLKDVEMTKIGEDDM